MFFFGWPFNMTKWYAKLKRHRFRILHDFTVTAALCQTDHCPRPSSKSIRAQITWLMQENENKCGTQNSLHHSTG